MKPCITVLGSVNMDLVFRTPRMPLPGETLADACFHQIPGGKGANQAVAAARMGAAVRFIGAVGDDLFGQDMRTTLSQEGIDLTHLAVRPGMATGVAGILVSADGENSIVLAAGANATVDEAWIAHAGPALAGSDYMLCQLETPLAGVLQTMRLARQQGSKVLLNPAPMCALGTADLALADVLVLNETEATQLTGLAVRDVASAERAAQTLAGMGVPSVLLTLGAAGVMLMDAGTARHLPGFVVDVVDTTAAGDTFVGSLAVELALGRTLSEACRTAQAAAALAVTVLGAQTSIPRRAQVEAFLAQHSGLPA